MQNAARQVRQEVTGSLVKVLELAQGDAGSTFQGLVVHRSPVNRECEHAMLSGRPP